MDIIIDIFLVVSGVILLVCMVMLIAEISKIIYRETLCYKTFRSTAKVIDKRYEEPYISGYITNVGRVMIPKHRMHPAQFNVYLMYKDKEYCLDDEDLYKSVKKGDIVKVRVHIGYDTQNRVKHTYLSVLD